MNNEDISELILLRTKSNGSIELCSNKGFSNDFISIASEFNNQNSFLKKYSDKNILCCSCLSNSPETVVITSKYIEEQIAGLFPDEKNLFFFADEFIDCNGNVIENLSEPNINKVLKQVFALKPKKVLIHLLNGAKNPAHEKMFYNVLSVAGYKVSISEDCFGFK